MKKSYKKGSKISYPNSYILAVPQVEWQEEKNVRPEVSYEAEKAVTTGKWEPVTNRKRDGVKVAPSGKHTITWTISPGLASVYALRFKYMNMSDKPIIAKMQILSSDDRIMREGELQFPSAPEKWRMISTTTGAYINAGHYKVIISGDNLEGLVFDALDMQ